MKKITLIILGLLVGFIGCANKSALKRTFDPSFGMAEQEYQALLDKTIVSQNNNERLKKFIKKYKDGDDVYIAAIGGSVTEGAGPASFTDGYFYQFLRKLTKEYDRQIGKRTITNNAALSGTSSAIGWVRYQTDVVDVLKHAPDLLIIEFAVNDFGEPTNARAFEAMIARALNDNPDCAVIVIYSAATYGNTMGIMKPVADYYNVLQLNILGAVKTPMDKGIIKQEAFFTDIVHPTTQGHKFMADALINLFRKVEASKKDKPVEVPSQTKLNPNFVNLVRIFSDDEHVKIQAGDFDQIDEKCQTVVKTNKSNFPHNWCHKSGSNSFKMDINCKNLIFMFKEGDAASKEVDYGTAQVFVDGKLVETCVGKKEGGWNNPNVKVIINEKEAKNHHVEVKMIDGDENKQFTIVAMGYSR